MGKIGIYTAALQNRRTGIGHYVEGLVNGLIEQGHKDDIVLIHPEGYHPLYDVVENHTTIKNCECLHFPSHFPSVTVKPIHKYLTKVPLIFTIHDVIPLFYPQYSPFIKSMLWRITSTYASHKAASIITVSEYSRQDIIKHLHVDPNKIHVVYTAPDPIFRQLPDSQNPVGEPYILTVVSIEPRKNIPNLVKAYEILRDHGHQHKLVIIGGDQWGTKPSYQAITQSKYAKDIIHLRYKPKEETVNYYNSADLFVWPSLYEGFGLPPLEAMACGCPVVTSNVTSIPEVVGDAALLCNPYDPEDIAEKMDIALSMDRQILIQKGLARARQFTWDKVVQQTWDVYCSVVGQ